MTHHLVDSAVADIINDFNRIAFSHDLFPRIIGVSVDNQLLVPFRAVFRLNAIPCYEVLKALNVRFNKVVITVKYETDVVIEVYDDSLPL